MYFEGDHTVSHTWLNINVIKLEQKRDINEFYLMLPAPFSEYNSPAPPTETTSTTLLRTSELSSSQSPCRKDGIVQFSIKIFNLDNFISFPARVAAPPNRTSLQHLFFLLPTLCSFVSIRVCVFLLSL